jgi:hypothetical protein
MYGFKAPQDERTRALVGGLNQTYKHSVLCITMSKLPPVAWATDDEDKDGDYLSDRNHCGGLTRQCLFGDCSVHGRQIKVSPVTFVEKSTRTWLGKAEEGRHCGAWPCSFVTINPCDEAFQTWQCLYPVQIDI